MVVVKVWMVCYNVVLVVLSVVCCELLCECLGVVGEGVVICLLFYCDYGSYIYLGCDVFFNYNCVIFDVVEVCIGDGI